jgi:hypothetical protein
MPHTKGNWHQGAGNGEGSIFADKGRMRMTENGTSLWPICQVTRGWDAEEDEANARLIAAAPELLAACKAAENLIHRLKRPVKEHYHELVTIACAIKKAEG